ncbi:ABC transporter substrate-binding protein [Bacillus sp. DNRA2]|uniref:ABC transporter substrate-binding protein n=1 Tax=Bacillus sp. DNRA2 TaxID=2723053 RepID=UPI00145C3C62|nr:ABC transporter substrate-binding protein [Bacillus sp. DNRA2]NMD68671.1 ABC transporter substrate-binding protein [Bacillus sp. DNRA2]
MRQTKFSIAILVLFLSIVLAACSVDSEAADARSTKAGKSTTVYDYLSREVVIPDKVERIACLYAFTGHVVTMLGEGDKIVAVNNGLQRDNLLNEINPVISDAVVPNRGDKINIEELANIGPDLIFIQESTAKDEGEVRKLDELNIPYLVVNFNSIEEQQQAIAMIGKAIGRSREAERYIDFYNDIIAQVSEGVKNIPEKYRIRVYHSVNEATRTDAAGSLPAEWMKIAGVTNVSVGENLKLTDGKYFANLEQILLWNPEAILVNEDGVSDYILSNPQWETLQAVKNKKVYQLPNGVSRWGHPGGLETPLAILWTAKTLYPDKFSEVNMEEVTGEFYQDFFNYKLDEDYIAKILSGKNMRIPKGN